MTSADAFSILKLPTQSNIGIDLEFITDSNKTNLYYPKPCILQISSGADAIIIDLLNTNPNKMKACKTLLKDKTITKILHDCSCDVSLLYNVLNWPIYNIFDTQIAWRFCNDNITISYKAIVKKMFELDLPKEQQVSDWTMRPSNTH